MLGIYSVYVVLLLSLVGAGSVVIAHFILDIGDLGFPIFLTLSVFLEVYWFYFLKSAFLFHSFYSLFLFSILLLIFISFSLLCVCLF